MGKAGRGQPLCPLLRGKRQMHRIKSPIGRLGRIRSADAVAEQVAEKRLFDFPFYGKFFRSALRFEDHRFGEIGAADVDVFAELDRAARARDHDAAVAEYGKIFRRKPIGADIAGRSVFAAEIRFAEIVEARMLGMGKVSCGRCGDFRPAVAGKRQKLFELVASDVDQYPSRIFAPKKPVGPAAAQFVRREDGYVQDFSDFAPPDCLFRVQRGFACEALGIKYKIFFPRSAHGAPYRIELAERDYGRFRDEEVFSGFHGADGERAAPRGDIRTGDQPNRRIAQDLLFALCGLRLREGLSELRHERFVGVIYVFDFGPCIRKTAAHGIDVPVRQPDRRKEKRLHHSFLPV